MLWRSISLSSTTRRRFMCGSTNFLIRSKQLLRASAVAGFTV
jgi:hypothetical protein